MSTREIGGGSLYLCVKTLLLPENLVRIGFKMGGFIASLSLSESFAVEFRLLPGTQLFRRQAAGGLHEGEHRDDDGKRKEKEDKTVLGSGMTLVYI